MDSLKNLPIKYLVVYVIYSDRSVLDQLIQTLKDLEPSERGEAMEREEVSL